MKAAEGLALVLFDVLGRITNGGDFFGSVIGDFDTEFFFERHDQLDDIEAVRTEIIDEAGFLGDLVGLDAEMLDDNLLHAVGSIAHCNPSQIWGLLNCLSP